MGILAFGVNFIQLFLSKVGKQAVKADQRNTSRLLTEPFKAILQQDFEPAKPEMEILVKALSKPTDGKLSGKSVEVRGNAYRV